MAHAEEGNNEWEEGVPLRTGRKRGMKKKDKLAIDIVGDSA